MKNKLDKNIATYEVQIRKIYSLFYSTNEQIDTEKANHLTKIVIGKILKSYKNEDITPPIIPENELIKIFSTEELEGKKLVAITGLLLSISIKIEYYINDIKSDDWELMKIIESCWPDSHGINIGINKSILGHANAMQILSQSIQ